MGGPAWFLDSPIPALLSFLGPETALITKLHNMDMQPLTLLSDSSSGNDSKQSLSSC